MNAAVVLSLLALTVQGANVQMEPKVKTFASDNWLSERRAGAEDTVEPMFVLKHDAEAVKAFEAKLLDISNPKSKNFSKYMSKAEIKEALGPKEDAIKTVVDYLQSFGVNTTTVNANGDMIQAKMPASTAEKILSTEFAQFRNVRERGTVISRITKPYFLPEEVASVVSIVEDIMRFPALKKPLLSFGAEESADDEFAACGNQCNGYTTPAVLQAAYGYTDITEVSSGNSMSVAEFQGQYYDQKDLDTFSSACDVTVTVEEAVGGNKENLCDRGGCVESLLDIEYIGAISHPIPLTVVYSNTFSLFDWVNSVMEMDNPPLVNSVSYGNDEVQQTSAEYMESTNTAFMQAGAMGLSILFASGDQGVWGRSGTGTDDRGNSNPYHPDFPAGSPYVTAVGGTNFQQKSVIGFESTWSCGGGGFSDEFATPEWQQDVVDAYLSTAAAQGVLPESRLFNPKGRGYPDLAALGGETNPYCIVTSGGKYGGVAGTSASCPVVAGIFANLNNERMAAGKAPMGWLNQFIYANPQCFNDVNDGSMNNCYEGYSGFAALDGWDPATGFGSPIYSCLSTAANALP